MIKVLLGLLACIILNWLIISIYCTLYRSYEKKKKKTATTNGALRKDNNPLKEALVFVFFRVLYGWTRYNVILVGRIPSYFVRNIIYRYVFKADITRKTNIAGGCEIRSPWKLHADNCIIMNNCILDARQGIEIGQNVVFGSGVHIWTEEHSIDDPMFRVLDENKGTVVIGDRAWICSDSTILPGCIIGQGGVLASRACLTKNVEDYGVYAGVPAKKIAHRCEHLEYKLSGHPGWLFY